MKKTVVCCVSVLVMVCLLMGVCAEPRMVTSICGVCGSQGVMIDDDPRDYWITTYWRDGLPYFAEHIRHYRTWKCSYQPCINVWQDEYVVIIEHLDTDMPIN